MRKSISTNKNENKQTKKTDIQVLWACCTVYLGNHEQFYKCNSAFRGMLGHEAETLAQRLCVKFGTQGKTQIATCQNNPSSRSEEKELFNSTSLLLMDISSFDWPGLYHMPIPDPVICKEEWTVLYWLSQWRPGDDCQVLAQASSIMQIIIDKDMFVRLRFTRTVLQCIHVSLRNKKKPLNVILS